MDTQVLVALITVGAGGILTSPLLIKLIDRRADAARQAVSASVDGVKAATSEIETVKSAMQSLQLLTTELRADLVLEREHSKSLNDDLLEEKALSISLSRELAARMGKDPDDVIAAVHRGQRYPPEGAAPQPP